MNKKTLSIALTAGLALGAAFAASPALAVSRDAGELNLDFGGPEALGIQYNDVAVDTTYESAVWTTSVSDGTNTYVAGSNQANGWGNRAILVSKYTNGVRDNSFGGDGVAEFKLDNPDVTLNRVKDIQFAANGELVIFGSGWDDQTKLVEQEVAFALRISATGTNTIAGVWGNAAGDAVELGDNLNLGLYYDPFLPFNEETYTETWFTGAVTYNYDGMQKWAVAGGSWVYDEYGWVLSLTDDGQIYGGDGAGEVAGYQFTDSNYNVDAATGPSCGGYSWTTDIEYDELNSRVILLASCAETEALYAFDSSNLMPVVGWGLSASVDGYLETHVPFTDLDWSSQLELRNNSGSMEYILGGSSWSTGMPWLGLLDSTGALIVENTDSSLETDPKYSGYDINDMIIGADGLVYFTGTVNTGYDDDLWSMRWDSNNQTDTTWNASGLSNHQIDGSCVSEYAYSMGISGTELMLFGESSAPEPDQLAYYGDGDWGTLVSSVFTGGATQTATVGSAPEWDDTTVELEAWTTEEYSDSIAAQGTDIMYYVSGSSLNEGLTWEVVNGVVQISGTPTNTDDDQFINVCAQNEFGHVWTTIEIDTVSPLPYAPVSTGPADLGDVAAGGAIEHTIPVDASPVATCAITDGELPAGLTLDTDTCVISGTPTTPGDYIFIVTATNSEGSFDFEYSGTIAEEPVDVVEEEEETQELASTGVDSAALTALASIAAFAVIAGAGASMRRREGARR